MPRKTDKRERLIDAAKALIHKQGFNLTTLADIAQEADVPLGNVYYYFKTKESIGETVVKELGDELENRLKMWDENHNPVQRLRSYVNYAIEEADETARFGCPIGGLCQELGKMGGPLADAAAKLLNDVLGWCEKQFFALGHAKNSSRLALNLVSNVQGMYLLTHTFKDPQIAVRQARFLQEYLDNVEEGKSARYESARAGAV